MPHVTNKIVLAKDTADKIFPACCPDGAFSFAKLIPSPYPDFVALIDTSDEMSKWVEWNITHWGTKFPAFEQAIGLEGDKVYIKYKTMHNIAYPVMAVFAQKFRVPFEHHYIHEDFLFWGIERWGHTPQTGSTVWRLSIERDVKKDKLPLCIDLLGYEPQKLEEADNR